MHPTAEQKIRYALTSANEDLKIIVDSCARPTKFNDLRFRISWSNFLTSSNRVFSALEQGTKASAVDRAWMVTCKSTRKSDPLLRYMQHARNADEHGVESVTGLTPGRLVFGTEGAEIGYLEEFDGKTGRFQTGPAYHSEGMDIRHATELKIYPSKPRLLPVRDRGIVYHPPEEHLERPIADASPANVALLMMNYLIAKTREAQAL